MGIREQIGEILLPGIGDFEGNGHPAFRELCLAQKDELQILDFHGFRSEVGNVTPLREPDSPIIEINNCGTRITHRECEHCGCGSHGLRFMYFPRNRIGCKTPRLIDIRRDFAPDVDLMREQKEAYECPRKQRKNPRAEEDLEEGEP